MRITNDENERRESFDQVAALYNQVRPSYPSALFEDVIAFSNLPPDGQILEIGCGTGQATLPFARQGYSICCLEPGASLAALAQQNLASYPKCKVVISTFEAWAEDEASFDLMIQQQPFIGLILLYVIKEQHRFSNLRVRSLYFGTSMCRQK